MVSWCGHEVRTFHHEGSDVMKTQKTYWLSTVLVAGGLVWSGYAETGPQMERQRRGEQIERGPRAERVAREEYGMRGDRAERRERAERGERGPRADRAERGERDGRGERAERSTREMRPERAPQRSVWDDAEFAELREAHQAARARVREMMQDAQSTEEELLAAVRRAGRLNIRVQEERVRRLVAQRDQAAARRDQRPSVGRVRSPQMRCVADCPYQRQAKESPRR